jgi:hypothetical protein
MTDITTIPTTEPELVEVPEMLFLAVDGQGPPSGARFDEAVGAILAAGKRAGAAGPLEGLWWTGSETELDITREEAFSWTLLLAVSGDAEEPAPPVSLRALAEGSCAQVLHIGPYEEEAPTIERLLRWMAERRLVKNGAHHEVYLDDPRTTAPERLRTIIRQPVRAA